MVINDELIGLARKGLAQVLAILILRCLLGIVVEPPEMIKQIQLPKEDFVRLVLKLLKTSSLPLSELRLFCFPRGNQTALLNLQEGEKASRTDSLARNSPGQSLYHVQTHGGLIWN